MLPSGIGLHFVLSFLTNPDLTEADLHDLSETEHAVWDYLSEKGVYVKKDTILKALGLKSDVTVLEEMTQKGLLYCNTDTQRKIGDATVRMVRLTKEWLENDAPCKVTKKQKDVLTFLENVGTASVKEICYFTGVTTAVISTLHSKKLIDYFENEIFRRPKFEKQSSIKAEIHLTEEQQKAYIGLSQALQSEKSKTALLFGVTGSGKTQVFLKLIDDTLQKGRGVIVMVPEISLTPQMLSIFYERYGSEVAVFHSALSMGERLDEWKRVKKGEAKKWSKDVAEYFQKELNKLLHINQQSPDYNVQLNYLQTMLNLPWDECTEDNLNIKNAEKVLDKDHFGLKKVKERILEHLSVLKLKKDFKSPIICLYGPPGVGKTSLGRSIAAALKRKYIRMSLGGVHDEAEIRGHRKTYIGAMPGRILKGLIKAGSSNPVFILDEIDKISSDRQGDPASALLEVLDPEQNNTFHDNYLDLDYDLSKVMFIATANNIGTIPAPLLDRMELIEVSGYILEEKVEIARKHLIPKAIVANGLEDVNLRFTRQAIEKIIGSYTRESGVRELEKKINKIMRKQARFVAEDGQVHDEVIKPGNVPFYLGKEEYFNDKYQGNEYAGVVTGLAWTAVGGEILFIETSLSKGKGNKLTLTGNLGDVMKESAMLAFEYVHSHAAALGIPYEVFDNWNVHVHVPEGAIPKDGPSAGITMTTAIASALTQRKVRANLAMTGEITLRGKVLPVGGIKEKILAAKRAGITDIIMCRENERDILDIEPMYIDGLTFHYVDDVREVLDYALLDEKVANPLDLSK